MKRLLRNQDVCMKHDNPWWKIFFFFLVNKSSPLAQFSIDYEEIDDDDDEEQQQQQPQNNNDQHSWNHQSEKSKYEFPVNIEQLPLTKFFIFSIPNGKPSSTTKNSQKEATTTNDKDIPDESTRSGGIR